MTSYDTGRLNTGASWEAEGFRFKDDLRATKAFISNIDDVLKKKIEDGISALRTDIEERSVDILIRALDREVDGVKKLYGKSYGHGAG